MTLRVGGDYVAKKQRDDETQKFDVKAAAALFSIEDVEAAAAKALADVFDPLPPQEFCDYTRIPTSTLFMMLVETAQVQYLTSERGYPWEVIARDHRVVQQEQRVADIQAEIDRRFPVSETP